MDIHFSFTLRINTNKRNIILVHFVDWLFHALETLANQLLSNYHISMIPSNILNLSSPSTELLTHFGFNLITLTPQSNFLKKTKPIQEKLLCSGHLSMTGTILRSRWCPLQRGFTEFHLFYTFKKYFLIQEFLQKVIKIIKS